MLPLVTQCFVEFLDLMRMMESSDILKCDLDPTNIKKEVFQGGKVATSIPAHNSSGPARSDVSSQQMLIPNLDDMFTRKCRSVQGEIKIKVPNPDYWIKHFPEFVDNGESASKSVWNVANSYFELVDSLTQKEDGERMNNAGDVGVCEASLSYLLRALCGIRHLEESTYNRQYLLEMQGKTRRSCKKGWMILVVLSKKSETCEEAVNLKKTNTDLEAANHEYEVKAAVDFAAGFADAIAQVQVLAPKGAAICS
ncbi:hypothetical protein P8452_58543 [Trifolium repens]|nr:hypothetical protein P8452_58543 [Trifolium repens]